MAITLWNVISMYLILDIAFLITSLFTLHFPAWKVAEQWALEYKEESLKNIKEFGWKYKLSHTIAYILVAFVLFPVLFPIILISNSGAISGYSNTIINGIGEKNE